MVIEKIEAELQKVYAKIEELKNKAKDLEEQKKQAKDMEYLSIIRKSGISSAELQRLIAIQENENRQILQGKGAERNEIEEME